MSILSKPYFHDEKAAFAFLEEVLWPNGPVCPHCGEAKRVYVLNGVKGKALYNKDGSIRREAKERFGLKKCGACRKQFTVRVRTVFESSHVPLPMWLQAAHLLCSSKKGFSAHQLHRVLEVQYKTALFIWGRLRAAMASGDLSPFGQGGTPVEIDETYIGKNPDAPKSRTPLRNMNRVLTMVDRQTGRSRSMLVEDFTIAGVTPILQANLSKEARILTDEAHVYKTPAKDFASHNTVNHAQDEYVSKEEPWIHTNTVEGYFGIFKRGMKGIYQHCSKRHLHRYLAEFDFRYSNRIAVGIDDEARTNLALRGAVGKRLYYRQPV
jgi:transposase-like protein